MGRDNYSYQKYQKELAKKKKVEEKKQKKLDRKAAEALPGTGLDVPGLAIQDGAPSGVAEVVSDGGAGAEKTGLS